MKMAFRIAVALQLAMVNVAMSSVANAATSAASSPTDAAIPGTGFSTFGALVQGLFGLVIVLAALMAFFWLLRRFSPGQTGAQGAVKVVGGVMLGTRERLVVVEVDGTWLLLGVGGGQITAVHTMPRPQGYESPAIPVGAGFAEKLKEFLPKRSN
jgi:flagellar protein FliO/FliZ